MADKAKRMCSYPGCPNLVLSGRCAEHKRVEPVRESALSRGYNYRWQKYRKGYLINNPLCVKCLEDGDVTKATVVDHVIPHRGDALLFWDRDNHQALCKRHHDIKTAKEDGGFGNKRVF